MSSGDCLRCGSPMPPKMTLGCQDGDIDAQALYPPQAQYGRATGRYYFRTQRQGQMMCVDPRDLAVSADLWKAVETVSENVLLVEAGLV